MLEDLIVAAFVVKGFDVFANTIKAASGLWREYDRVSNLTNIRPADKQRWLSALQGQMDGLEKIIQQAGVIGKLFGAGGLILAGLVRMTTQTAAFAAEVANLRDVMGTSEQNAYSFASMFNALGVRDQQAMRTVLHLNRATFDSNGMAALSRLGIPANPNVSGFELFNQIADKLQKVPAGQRRTKILQDLFGGTGFAGTNGVLAILPLLRLTQDERKEMLALGEAYDSSLVRKSQDFTVNLAAIKQGLMNNLVQPIVSDLLPAFNMVLSIGEEMITWFGRLDRATGGIFTWILALTTVALSFILIGTAISKTIALVQLLTQQIWLQNIALGVRNALSNPWGLAIAGAAVAGIVGAAIYNKTSSSDDEQGKVDEFGQHVDRFGEWVNRMPDSFDSIRGHGIPSKISQTDTAVLARKFAIDNLG